MLPSITEIGALVKVKSADVKPAARAAGTVNGSGFDRLGFGSLVLFVQTGAATGTPTTQSVIAKIQHSDDNSTFTDLSGGAVSALTADNSNGRLNVNLAKAKRYIRIAVVTAFTGGTSPTQLSAAMMVLGGARDLPVADA